MNKLLMIAFASAFISAAQSASAMEEEPDGVFSITPVLERSCVAVRVPVNLTQALAGVRWYNNDGMTVFPKVLAASGLRDLPPLYSDGIEAAANVGGGESSWTEIAFYEPIGSQTMSLYVIFQLPMNEQGAGVGSGPGIGYVASEESACIYVSGDGDEWSRLTAGYRLLVDPVYTDRGGATLALKCSLGTEDESLDETGGLPEVIVERTEILPPYPNPFNPSTTVAFTLVKPGRVRVNIYDLRGRLVRELTNGYHERGRYETTWHGRDDHGRRVASGMYFARMQAGGVEQIQRMVLVK